VGGVEPEVVSSTLEDYLETILSLAEEKGAARVRDIASRLGVHKSTVTAALKALAEKGFVNYAPYEIATLTKEGARIAERVTHDHEAIQWFLKEMLLVDDDVAEANACRMEHVIDKRVVERLLLLGRCLKDCRDSTGNCLKTFAERI